MIKPSIVTSFGNAIREMTFHWGTRDCNTVALKFLDVVMFKKKEYESITDEVVGKYDNEKRAVRFYIKYDKTWDSYLTKFCDKNPENKPAFQPGDILTVGTHPFVMVHVCLGGKTASMDPEIGGSIINTLDLLRQQEVTIYRPRA